MESEPWLTVIVPAFNEEGTLDELLCRLRDGPYPEKEIIVVDDGSRDTTPAILNRWSSQPGFKVIWHTENQGKGVAVRTALAQARGTITVVQDADLEYNPAELPQLIEPLRRAEAVVVYGSRYLRPDVRPPWSMFRLGVILLNYLILVLYWRRLTDEATGYKVAPTALLRRLGLQARRFELCAEMTAKLCRLGVPIKEISISYRPRTKAEGKKISWRDAWPTIWTLLKWRFLPLRPALPATTLPRCAKAHV